MNEHSYNLRKAYAKNSKYYNENFEAYENFEDNFDDHKINLRKKRYSKQYFSSNIHKWEIDFMIIPFNFNPPESILKHFRTSTRYVFLSFKNVLL
jgi:hypothetical protein